MVLKSKYPVFITLSFSAITGIYFLLMFNKEVMALAAGAIGLITLGFIVYLSIGARVQNTFTYSLRNSDTVLYKGKVHYYISEQPMAGTLYLIDDKLVFQSGASGPRQKTEIILFLNEVREVSFERTHRDEHKNIVIITADGNERFLVKGNQLWIDEIENALRKA